MDAYFEKLHVFNEAINLDIELVMRQKILRLLGTTVLFFLMSGYVSHLALAESDLAKDLAIQKEITQIKLNALRDDVDSLHKRIDDEITARGQGIDRFGILITLILAGFGILGSIAVIRKTKEDAREWLNENAAQILDDLKEQALKRMDESINDLQDQSTQLFAQMQDRIGSGNSDDIYSQRDIASDDDKLLLDRLENELRHHPESGYSFDDWNTRAFAAYANQNFADAIHFWSRASQAHGATAVEVANALFNKGVTQRALRDDAGAIASYSDIISKFGSAPEVALREQVAKSLINKGVIQRAQGDYTGAIASYHEIVSRFGRDPEAMLQEAVAGAHFNLAEIQRAQGDRESAIASYKEIVSKFGCAPEVALQDLVAKAKQGLNELLCPTTL